jgi:hypothetical protein
MSTSIEKKHRAARQATGQGANNSLSFGSFCGRRSLGACLAYDLLSLFSPLVRQLVPIRVAVAGNNLLVRMVS